MFQPLQRGDRQLSFFQIEKKTFGFHGLYKNNKAL